MDKVVKVMGDREGLHPPDTADTMLWFPEKFISIHSASTKIIHFGDRRWLT
jgi:hypothetical protein